MGTQISYGPSLVILVIGIFLLLVAIVGGGLEIKEIKIPKIERMPRILTALLGAMLMICGASVGVLSFMVAPLSSPSQEVSIPTQISGNYTPNTQYIQVDQIQLPQEPGLSEDVRKAAAALIVNADKAEILANFYQDDAYLTYYYAGYALQQMQQNIEIISQSGYIELDDIDLGRSYYVNMYLNNNVLLIDECEYWKMYLYDPSTGELVYESDWTLIPQTIGIELVENQVYITTISFYQNNAFCTE